MFQEPSKKASYVATRPPQLDYQYNYLCMPYYPAPYFDPNYYRPHN